MKAILERINKIKISSIIIVLLIFHVVLNFDDCKKGFNDGWNDAYKKRKTNIISQ
jgi:hypothetical protein